MAGGKMSGSKMAGGKMDSAMEGRRMAWYKKTYGAKWQNHYNPKM